MAFANRYIAAMANAYDQAQKRSKTTDAQIAAVRSKIVAADGAIGNAVELNPLVGLMDMVVMVTLTRQIAEQPWPNELFGADAAATIVTVLESQETDVWNLASAYLTPEQIAELHKLCEQWQQDHPDQRYAINVRLSDFPQAKQKGAGFQLVNSVFGIVTLDPFNGLDPAVREVEQSRILAERMFFYLRHMPSLLTWQADSLYLQMLDEPQVKQVLKDTTTVAGSTTRVSDATTQVAEASSRFADTIERFRVQLPDQQATLVTQLNDLIATQRDAALKQATTQVSIEREATIKQLNSTVDAQQDLMTKNLQGVMDKSIDRLYARMRSVVLIATASILAAFVIYRVIAVSFFGKKGRA